MADSAPYPVHVRPSALRLTLLTLTVCAIDAMSGGELLLSARVEEGIRFELRAPQAGSWNVDDWRFAALKKIVAADAGELHLDAAAAVLRYQPIAN